MEACIIFYAALCGQGHDECLACGVGVLHVWDLNSFLRILTSILHSSATIDPVAQW